MVHNTCCQGSGLVELYDTKHNVPKVVHKKGLQRFELQSLVKYSASIFLVLPLGLSLSSPLSVRESLPQHNSHTALPNAP